MVFVCVRVQSDSPYMDVIINANFSSKVSNDSVMYQDVKWTQVIIGQDQNTDGTVNSDHPFEGRISGLNIWQGVFSRENTKNWYNKGKKHYQPNIIKWPQLGASANRVGDVYFVQVTSASRSKFNSTMLFNVPNGKVI